MGSLEAMPVHPRLRKTANLSHLLTDAVSQLLAQQPGDTAMMAVKKQTKKGFLSHLSVPSTRKHLVMLVCSLLLFVLLFVIHPFRNFQVIGLGGFPISLSYPTP